MLGLDEAATLLEGRYLENQPAGEWYQRNGKPFIAVNSLNLRGKAGFEYAVPGLGYVVDDDSRLLEARGGRLSGSVMEQGA